MISGGTSGGRRKSLDAEVNLVPFIDLLSMCICFLLMTAVWIQIGMMPVKQSHGTEAAAAPTQAYELEVRFLGPTAVETVFKQKGRITRKFVTQDADVAAIPARFQADLGPALSAIGLNPAELIAASLAGSAASADGVRRVATVISSGMITPAVGVDYGEMVSVMDVLRRHLIVNLGVVPVRSGA